MGELALRYPERSLVVSTGAESGSEASDAAFPVTVDRVNTPARRLRSVTGLVRWSIQVERLARARGVTFAWCGNLRPAAYPARWLKARTGTPYGVVLHGGDILRLATLMAHSGPRRVTARTLLAGASVLVTNSRYTRDVTLRFLADIGVARPEGEVVVVPLGTDPARFTPGPAFEEAGRRLGLDEGRWMVTVARLTPHKGIDTGLEVLARLLPTYPELGYAIAGTGPDALRLRALADRLGVSARVRWLGGVADEDIQTLHRASTLYLGLSRIEGVEVEGFGIALVEASACCVPVIGGRSGGVPDAVQEGVTGLLVDPKSVDEAAEAVRRILDDPALGRTLGAQGRREVERNYNWERVARDMRRLGDEVSAGRPPSAR